MNELITTATKDGKNFAILLKCLKSGLGTYEVTFEALRDHYKPFLNDDFEEAFREGLK